MPFFTDNFTGTAGATIQSRSPDLGTGWTQHTSSAGTIVISDANRARAGTTGDLYYYADAAPGAVAEYDSEMTIRLVGAASMFYGVAGRMSTSAVTMYVARNDTLNGRAELVRISAGSSTSLGTYSYTISSGVDNVIKGEWRDAAKKLILNGTERISSADNTITAAGRPGIHIFGFTASNAAGMHGDAFNASVPAGGGTPQELAGSVAGTGHITAGLSVSKPLSASSAGAGAVVASLTVGKRLSASMAGAGAVSAALGVSKPLTATLAGSGHVSASATVSKPLASSVAGAGHISADLTVTPAGIALAASPAGGGFIAATLTVQKALGAQLAGAGASTAALQVQKPLTASLAGTAHISATLFVGVASYVFATLRAYPALTTSLAARPVHTTALSVRQE